MVPVGRQNAYLHWIACSWKLSELDVGAVLGLEFFHAGFCGRDTLESGDVDRGHHPRAPGADCFGRSPGQNPAWRVTSPSPKASLKVARRYCALADSHPSFTWSRTMPLCEARTQRVCGPRPDSMRGLLRRAGEQHSELAHDVEHSSHPARMPICRNARLRPSRKARSGHLLGSRQRAASRRAGSH